MAGEQKKKSSRAKPKRDKPEDKNEPAQNVEPIPEKPVNVQGVEPDMSIAEPEPAETCERAPCPVVGVGASAGGLEALQGLFQHVPADLNVAFVVVQHRAADRTSVMKSLLEKHTQLTVKDIEDGMKVESGTVYLGPADKDVSILNGALFPVKPPAHAGLHLPIDSFLRSLAMDEADRAICIILSGTGSDGTLGLKEIKAAGGLVIVQEESQAKYDSMPRNAIDTGMVDFVLPVEKMGEQLAQYIGHPCLAKRKPPDMEKDLETQLQKIFVLICAETGHDFSHYKRNTIQRRIARRLAVHQIEDLDHYVQYLQENAEEVRTLAKELLITVTNFFRDREAFEALNELVIKPLVEQKGPDAFIRVWVAGCATGEEAYSVAVLLYEEISTSEKHITVQIFATDIDEESTEVARRGLYPKSIAGDVSPARLQRFFTEENNHYRVKNIVRETIVFAKHNLIKDAPFSKLDLLCCRNVLIYMDSTLQKKLIPMFHYTLNPGGSLFLGESESIGSFSDLYVPADARHKIFKRKPVTTSYGPETEIGNYAQIEPARTDKAQGKKRQQVIGEIGEKVILRDYSAPCVLVGEDYNVVYFNGDVNKYLIQPGGKPTFNILQMARPEIHHRLNLLLRHVFHEKRMAVEKDVQVRVNDHYVDTDIIVRPINEPDVGGNLLLVVFQAKRKEKKSGQEEETSPVHLPEKERDVRIRELEQELQSTKEYLQTTIEELETSNEELKSSNEELQSTNEELQSTNEELDTSREELQSTNEELRTFNSEYQQKIEELAKGDDDLNNLMMTADVATLASMEAGELARAVVETVRQPLLILDKDLQVIDANPAFYRDFRVNPEDTVGQLVYDLGERQWDIRELRTLLEQIMPQNTRFEGFKVSHEFPRIGNRTFLLNARQTTLKGEATGRILVAFEDVTGQPEGK